MPLPIRVFRAVALIAALFVVAAGGTVRAAAERLTFETASGSHAFTVEVAATPEQRQTGLMYRRSLAPEHGMLFDFGKVEPVAMWMKNTYVSLDMVFVRADGAVQRIAKGTEPLSLEVIESGGPVRFVVEIAAGEADRIGLKPGDRAIHPVIQQRASR
ncbi:DUF192 domain-containing protein [Methylopila turkensis]|uniref:DUF192 domain-containing protein n=1 Tax=Methylopila turkensis TaxID=1437816 RepID=A0A9W6JL64_9HYPH|nr:DUF192 domain-containing protein [Methylopila turkensis]GLK78426.1 hypothetical protein GCM10008174_01670 [Methylopila turkensis]